MAATWRVFTQPLNPTLEVSLGSSSRQYVRFRLKLQLLSIVSKFSRVANMQPFSVSGKAILDGQRVLLSLQHSQAAAAKYPRDDVAAPPDVRDLIQSIGHGDLACHQSRLPVSMHEVRVMMNNTRMAIRLPKDTKSCRETELRLLRTLLQAKRPTTSKRTKAILDSGAVPRAIGDDNAGPKDDDTKDNAAAIEDCDKNPKDGGAVDIDQMDVDEVVSTEHKQDMDYANGNDNTESMDMDNGHDTAENGNNTKEEDHVDNHVSDGENSLSS